MNYIHDPFVYGDYNAPPIEPHPSFGNPVSWPQCGPAINSYLVPYSQPGCNGSNSFYPLPQFVEDYDEFVENLSRPRLTKDQVDTLETQFQAHPKPNSETKRQLALQTNLTLPRVANWFQNRRAKAKQQKRQEEFRKNQTKDQTENTESENCDASDSEISKRESSESIKSENTNESSTPVQEESMPPPRNVAPTTSSDQQGLNASASAEQTCAVGDEEHNDILPGFRTNLSLHVTDQEPTTQGSTEIPNLISHSMPDISTMEQTQSTTALWASSDTTGNMVTLGSSCPQRHMLHSPEFWPQEGNGNAQFAYESHCGSHSRAVTETMFASSDQFGQSLLPMMLSPFHSPDFSVQRRPSQQTDMSDSLVEATMDSVIEETSEDRVGSSQLALPINNTFSRRREKNIDLAARRKRPRPAAIGTSGLVRPLCGPSSMSPTTKVPGWGASNTLRHAKSTHNLGSALSPRYPGGVRKVSAPLRSPWGVAASMDSSTPSTACSAEFMVPPLVTASMAPHTPLTPEDMQYLLPPTPNEGQYCLSPNADTGCARMYPASQPTHVQSPPRTPLHPDVLSQVQYQLPGAPVSNCSGYEPPSLSLPVDAGMPAMWPNETGNLSMPVIHMPQPTYISPITQSDQLGDPGLAAENFSKSPPQCNAGGSPNLLSGLGSHPVTPKIKTEFLIEEFPNQQEAHKFAAKQLSSRRPEKYTFTNQTPTDYRAASEL